MVSPGDIREHVASLFIMLNKKTVILFRIEFLVALATLLFFAMFLMDFFRRIIHNSFMRSVFSVFDAVCDSIVVYLLGAMQSAPFKNQLFPVWALVLVNFRYSADYISGYGVPDRRGRRFTEWRNVFKLLGSAFLNWTRGSRFKGPLWLVWGLQIVRSGYRFSSHNLASRAVWHGGSSELVAEHMRAMHDETNMKQEFDPVTMKGYKYLVYGETKQKGGFKLKKPQYALSTDQAATKQKKTSPLVTLDKIWDCPIHEPHKQFKDGKDLSLAFALSRLLRCRLEDVTLQGRRIFDINRKLVKNIIDGKVGTSDALKIMELQLAFLHDYFNTRYPMVFWSGLRSLMSIPLPPILTICALCWLAVDIRKVYKPPNGELVNQVKGFNVDIIITWVFIFLMIVKEIWEMITYLHSDWTRLIMWCEYVQRKRKRTHEYVDTWVDSILLYFSRSKITDKRWHGFIDQYVFVQSYDDRPRFWNFIHNLTTGIIPKKDDGAALSGAIKVPEYVRQAVLEKLIKILENEQGSDLPGVIKTLSNNNLRKQLQNYQAYTAQERSTQMVLPTSTQIVLPTSTQIILPASTHFVVPENPDMVLQTSAHIVLPTSTNIVLSTSSHIVVPTSTDIVLPTSSHIILVWHIATSLCEMALATDYGVNLSNPRFPCSLWSWFTSCCSSKPYLMDVSEKKDSIWSWLTNCCLPKSKMEMEDKKKVDGKLPDHLRKTYIIANSLSRYCAYLLVSKPELIPDSFLVPKIVFQKTVKSARDGLLKDCDSLPKRFRKLMDEAEKPIKDFEKEDVLKQGVALGKELLNHLSEERRWEVLAEVWTELLIHIAPTSSAQAHKKCLSRGEFVTHIWALLWHHGVQKSSLWPEDVEPENNDPQVVHLGNDSDWAGNESRKTGGDIMRSDRIGINIDKANDNKRTQRAGGRQLKERTRRKKETGSSEIEEISQDVTVNTTNVQRGMAGQAQNESEGKKVRQCSRAPNVI
ncbi:hypothetical protein SEVIR_3G070300v4 [Setaria viridis]|uniref:DUF4220 domain-containing protein n=1 Tax=Setaria viridis TaxID=4556 RepID=A0A4U6V6B0_SETVI|nr:uncharacterized protein LOC117850623 [Setaria viridis]TKW24751.1 hypothetical protein SEVIR_3G070300v2 [Setaria viridis]